MLDFEEASIKAFKRTFPAIIKGCYFHFSKAVYQHAVSLGFGDYFSQNCENSLEFSYFFVSPMEEIDES